MLKDKSNKEEGTGRGSDITKRVELAQCETCKFERPPTSSVQYVPGRKINTKCKEFREFHEANFKENPNDPAAMERQANILSADAKAFADNAKKCSCPECAAISRELADRAFKLFDRLLEREPHDLHVIYLQSHMEVMRDGYSQAWRRAGKRALETPEDENARAKFVYVAYGALGALSKQLPENNSPLSSAESRLEASHIVQHAESLLKHNLAGPERYEILTLTRIAYRMLGNETKELDSFRARTRVADVPYTDRLDSFNQFAELLVQQPLRMHRAHFEPEKHIPAFTEAVEVMRDALALAKTVPLAVSPGEDAALVSVQRERLVWAVNDGLRTYELLLAELEKCDDRLWDDISEYRTMLQKNPYDQNTDALYRISVLALGDRFAGHLVRESRTNFLTEKVREFMVSNDGFVRNANFSGNRESGPRVSATLAVNAHLALLLHDFNAAAEYAENDLRISSVRPDFDRTDTNDSRITAAVAYHALKNEPECEKHIGKLRAENACVLSSYMDDDPVLREHFAYVWKRLE